MFIPTYRLIVFYPFQHPQVVQVDFDTAYEAAWELIYHIFGEGNEEFGDKIDRATEGIKALSDEQIYVVSDTPHIYEPEYASYGIVVALTTKGATP